jgi:hypothetical protein
VTWKVTLRTEEELTATVTADVDADEETLRELALQQADDGEVTWETVYAETSAVMVE